MAIVRSLTQQEGVDIEKLLDTSLAQLQQNSLYIDDLQAIQSMRGPLLAWCDDMCDRALSATAPSSRQGWGWLPFRDDAACRIGLLTLHDGHPISIHDHPGSTGLLLILQGSLRITNYQCTDSLRQAAKRQMVTLSEVGQHRLGAGEFTSFGPVEGNIHAVAAEGGPCVVLDILMSPYRDEERGWYMPLKDQIDTNKPFQAMRLCHTPVDASRSVA